MDEALQRVYNEIRKEIIKDNLKLMKNTSHEYITQAGEAFLDGLQVNGECIEIVSKDKYDNLLKENKQLKSENKELFLLKTNLNKKETRHLERIEDLEMEIKTLHNHHYQPKVKTSIKKKKFLNIF